jgi:integrase
MIDKNKLLDRYADNLAHSSNRNHYLRYARHFLDNSNGLDRVSIDQYSAMLRKEYSPGTVNFVFRVICRLFAVNDLPWPYRRGEAPTIKEREEYRPQLSPEIIEAMIRTAREGKLRTDEQCFLALSTIYGLRRAEMVNLRPEDVNLKSCTLYVSTVKFGRECYHLIPPEIKPYLETHDFNTRYGEATLSVIFRRILIKSTAGQLKSRLIGWRSIRRAVFEGLIKNGVNPLAARKFMRWKSATGDMKTFARHYGTVVVGLGITPSVLDEAEGDAKIFEKHPFLRFWRT